MTKLHENHPRLSPNPIETLVSLVTAESSTATSPSSTATVIQRGTDSITIQLDHPVGKFVNGRTHCSPLAVEKVGS